MLAGGAVVALSFPVKRARVNFAFPVIAILFACALIGGANAADDYPNRPIRLIIPFPPGGSNDIIGRMLGLKLGERMG